MKIEFRSTCPISSALDIVGDKWTLLILRDLLFLKKKTFTELTQSDEKIASNILSDRLNRLEEMGIISKGKLPDNKKTNIYSLTEKGIDFLPVMVEYILWSEKHLNSHIAEEAKQFAAMLKENKSAIIEKTRNDLLSQI